MLIPCYPDFAPIAFDLKPALQPLLFKLPDGISEYTFSNLYLFRNRYEYRLSLSPGGALIISGARDGKRFFMTPCAVPEKEVLIPLFEAHHYWKGIPDSLFTAHKDELARWGVALAEDRDNFDYLYLRTDLADLPGKKFHKKRNLVSAFLNAYTYEIRPLGPDNIHHALRVLERWRHDKAEDGDYNAAREALEQFGSLDMRGALYYVNGRPGAWCLGETLAQGRIFAVHFEKGIDECKGIYQFMNQTFAASLPEQITHINREQDLGDEGLRQAKMTYRPSGFVKKYLGSLRLF
ncbi:MAG: phosphatidylglycerol lysyltransferase domain-containing protein [Spirochaetaceae bacterium]|jgi:hypothetical protein|nr:phosphatidylglycerol lysyltransferase domain-containing protein [Spirochaetaceae bacterium]